MTGRQWNSSGHTLFCLKECCMHLMNKFSIVKVDFISLVYLQSDEKWAKRYAIELDESIGRTRFFVHRETETERWHLWGQKAFQMMSQVQFDLENIKNCEWVKKERGKEKESQEESNRPFRLQCNCFIHSTSFVARSMWFKKQVQQWVPERCQFFLCV